MEYNHEGHAEDAVKVTAGKMFEPMKIPKELSTKGVTHWNTLASGKGQNYFGGKEDRAPLTMHILYSQHWKKVKVGEYKDIFSAKDVAAGFFNGAYDALENNVVGVIDLFKNPTAIIEGIVLLDRYKEDPEARAIVDQLLSETMDELSKTISNAKTSKEISYLVGYVVAEIVISIVVSKGINKGLKSMKGVAKKAADKLIKSIKLTNKHINSYLGKAINNPLSNKTILGSTGAYDVIGKNKGYTYFKMTDSEWNNIVTKTANNYDEIWKVNEEFLKKQLAAKKEILFSNNPNKSYYFQDGTPRFFQREIDYLKNKGYKFVDNGDGLWKAVKK